MRKVLFGLIALSVVAAIYSNKIKLIQFVPPTASAAISASGVDGVIDVTGWKQDANPFSDDANATSSIVGYAEDSQLGVKANVGMKCSEEGRVAFIVGFANGTLDITTESHVHDNTYYDMLQGRTVGEVHTTQSQSITIDEKLESFGKDSIRLTPESAQKFSFVTYNASEFYKGSHFLIGVPMNGTEAVLRIPLKDKVIVDFLKPCTSIEQKAEQSQKAERAKCDKLKAAETAHDNCFDECARQNKGFNLLIPRCQEGCPPSVDFLRAACVD
jgi:hypothetical protein